jgi:hypothetical protein
MQKTNKADYIVHEWGTFLGMSGADGVALEGMYHEEHPLPDFVHSLSTDRLKVPRARSKGETPVIYFYSNVPRTVRVQVEFPQGIWTHWYPQAGMLGKLDIGSFPNAIAWLARITPPSDEGIPATTPEMLWNHARAVPEAATVRMTEKRDFMKPPTGEAERFIFYRGLGTTPLPVTLRLDQGKSGSVLTSRVPLAHIFVLRVENGKLAWQYFPRLDAGQKLTNVIPVIPAKNTHAQATMEDAIVAVSKKLEECLVQVGLFPAEAAAMVGTWRTGYFRTEGVRVLFILPRTWTEQTIPMTIHPQPKSLVRVMVGRLEALTPERENQVATDVGLLFAINTATQKRGFEGLRAQGRFLEPILRRIHANHPHPKTKQAAGKLLKTTFVTMLREEEMPTDASIEKHFQTLRTQILP